MKPFRTNKKDREVFCRVLGLGTLPNSDNIIAGIGSFNCRTIFEGLGQSGSPNRKWRFSRDGFQWTVAKLHELFPNNEAEVQLWPNHCIIRVWGDFCHEGSHYGYSTNTGEALFRAVVAMGEAQK